MWSTAHLHYKAITTEREEEERKLKEKILKLRELNSDFFKRESMASNSDFLGCTEERKQKGFFKVLNSVDVSSQNMRAIPHDFAKCFSEDELLGTMKLRMRGGRSWDVKMSKNPRFYFMEKSGWESFVRDNALGNECITFIHKGEMNFRVNIMKQSGTEILQPQQTRTFLSSSRQERVVSAGSSSRRTAAESNGRGMYKRKLNFGKKKNAEESQSSKRVETKRVVSNRRDDDAGPSSVSVAGFNVFISKAYLIQLAIPRSAAKDYMPKEKTWFKINHPDGKKSWHVSYIVNSGYYFSARWRILCKEYPVALGDTCRFTFINSRELLLVVTKP